VLALALDTVSLLGCVYIPKDAAKIMRTHMMFLREAALAKNVPSAPFSAQVLYPLFCGRIIPVKNFRGTLLHAATIAKKKYSTNMHLQGQRIPALAAYHTT
jgi:hypothetical protein